MNNKTLLIWGFMILVLFFCILCIYNSTKDELKFYEVKDELKISIKNYMNDNDIKIKNAYTYTISSKTLVEEEYIDEIKVEEQICDCDISIKRYIFYFYDFKFNCTK